MFYKKAENISGRMLRLIRSWLFREVQCAGFKIEYVNSIYYLPYT